MLQQFHVKLVLYDLLGREVKILADRMHEAGNYEVEWDGRDANGGFVPSGIYTYSIEAGNLKSTKKLVIVR
jgi:flagellar hook assembly protein FlgD